MLYFNFFSKCFLRCTGLHNLCKSVDVFEILMYVLHLNFIASRITSVCQLQKCK